MFLDKGKKSRESACIENDIGITALEKDRIVKKLKNDMNSKLIMRLFQPFDYEVSR
jgi:hypothetical protein